MTHKQLPELGEFVDSTSLLSDKALAERYPSDQSLKWFVRRHRDELAANCALILVAGRLCYHPTRFKQTVVEIGARAAGAAV